MTDAGSGWADERIDSAFRDRAARRPTPADLVSVTLARISSADVERPRNRIAWAAALAAVVTIALIAGSSVISLRRPTPTASNVAVASVPPSLDPTASPTPHTISMEFAVGAHRMTVEVVDESGRLLRAAPAPRDLAPGRPQGQIRATAVNGREDQVRIDWTGSACDPPTRLTIGASARRIDVTTFDGPIDAGLLCPLGGVPRAVVLTFDGPVQAEDIDLIGQPPGRELVPLEALGLPVVSVEEALRHRDESLDDTELAVAGWWYQSPLIHSCPLQLRPTSPIEPRCGDDLAKLVDAQPTTGLPAPTDGPELVPLLRDGVNWGTFDPRPVTGDAVVVLGHFEDHRSARCRDRDMCERAFVVDAVLDPANPRLGPPATEDFDVETVATIDDVQGFGVHNPATTVLSAYATTGASLTAVEPTASTSQELVGAPVVWVIRSLDLATPSEPRVETTLVIDRQPSTLWLGAFTQAGDGFTKMTYQRSP